MKFSTLFASFALSSVTVASWLPSSQRVMIDDETEYSVPGKNPLVFCENPENYILQIDYVDLSPTPPEAGKNLTIKAFGKLSEQVDDGAKLHLTLKWGLLTLHNKEEDLCENTKKIDKPCPFKKGDLVVSEEVAIPQQVPPGTYYVFANATTKDGQAITCMKATVSFPPH